MTIQCDKKVAILMATYNGEKYLSEQIESIINQTFTDWVLYIHDDGSTDDTLEIIKKYVKIYPKKIILIQGERTGGAKFNFFSLMDKVTAEYIMFSDQDDWWLPDKINKTLEKCIKIENGQKDTPVVVFTDLKVVNEKLKIINNRMSKYQKLEMKNTVFNKLMIQNVVTGCTMMINRKCRNIAIECKDRGQIIMHDWWCALIASYCGKIGYINEALILYRQHGDNSVGAKNIYSIAYLKNQIFKIAEQKKALLKTQQQISYFVKIYDISTPYIIEYGNLANKSKLSKIAFLLKNHIFKSGLIRNIGLFLIC